MGEVEGRSEEGGGRKEAKQGKRGGKSAQKSTKVR
jgi:hypothetical protein